MSKSYKRKAETLYKKILARMHNRVGTQTTYSNQLTTVGRSLFGRKFRGVFPADKIPDIKSGHLLIVNLDESHEPGSHWVGVAKDTNKIIWVYDSFGRNIHKILPRIYDQSDTVKSTERDAEQEEAEEDCGARTLAYLYIFDKHGSKYAKWL